jgi:uncharacterized protein with HEPN domain
MRTHDAIRLQHMLEAAREAVSFAQGRSRGDLKRDRMLVLSLVKAIKYASLHIWKAPQGAIRFF